MLFGWEKNGKNVTFSYWAPFHNILKVKTTDGRNLQLERNERGIFHGEMELQEGTRYYLELEKGEKIPDPFSRFQPEGVHGPSEIVNLQKNFYKRDIKKEELVIYEIHVGTFSQKGDFDGVIEKLDYLKDVGVNALEIMPVAQFPGKRGWGYDSTYLFAVQNSYGGPQLFRKMIDEIHSRGMYVILDVIYNHVGPEGNYLGKLGPYFSDVYRSPWGLSFNLDGRGSDLVREMILSNIEYWITYFDVDGFRLDAVHAIFDMSPVNILQEIAEKAHQMGRLVIAESDLNDPKIVRRRKECGYEIDAQWTDDFHHSLHAFVTGESSGYYTDFGKIDHIVKSLKDVFVYDGVYSRYRDKVFGSKVGNLDGCSFVVYLQNHDQVGNRGNGERISVLVDKEKLVASAALYILSPYIPMIFMGEEYGERNPFLYFSDFSESNLIEGVREGRRRDNGQNTDPQSEVTFNSSKLSWMKDEEILDSYKKLISIRRKIANRCRRDLRLNYGSGWIQMEREGLRATINFFCNALKIKKTGNIIFKYGKINENGNEIIFNGTGVAVEMVARPGFEPGTSGL